MEAGRLFAGLFSRGGPNTPAGLLPCRNGTGQMVGAVLKGVCCVRNRMPDQRHAEFVSGRERIEGFPVPEEWPKS